MMREMNSSFLFYFILFHLRENIHVAEGMREMKRGKVGVRMGDSRTPYLTYLRTKTGDNNTYR